MTRLLALTVSLLLAACGPTNGMNGGGNGDGGSSGGGADANPNSADARPPVLQASVYAHSSSTLYKVDPNTLAVTMVAPFGWPSGSDTMTDIAIDKDGNMVGVSFTNVYAVDKDTAACRLLAPLQSGLQFNGLSFVPGIGPDPNGPERLVGATTTGEVYQIDPNTGASTQVGAYGGNYGSSGDIVSVRGFGTVATVTNGGSTDILARLDPTTFAATPIGDTGYTQIWGVGFWENKVFGFTDTQKFVLIDTNTGAATEVDTANVTWWGAAVTTSAPVVN